MLPETVVCSIVIYELRYGAERSPDPVREHGKLDVFLSAFASVGLMD
jgi:predicted nucleic acid-binding protein